MSGGVKPEVRVVTGEGIAEDPTAYLLRSDHITYTRECTLSAWGIGNAHPNGHACIILRNKHVGVPLPLIPLILPTDIEAQPLVEPANHNPIYEHPFDSPFLHILHRFHQ
jgi:hypothetical protein